ncbi:MAG: DUF3224 domain-containing protein [Chloroflexia bacterium]|nr:DUF3224 domain-containing protein [Chloroflexia bacterium]
MPQAMATFTTDSWEETTYDEPSVGPKLLRATVRKTFSGELAGESQTELLLSQGTEGEAGYVAVERMAVRVGDRAGGFVLPHLATRGGAEPRTMWLVMPGSGTGELSGLHGTGVYGHDERGATFVLDYEFAG